MMPHPEKFSNPTQQAGSWHNEGALIEGTSALSKVPTQAFGCLAPTTPFYATVPIGDGFNWVERMAELQPGEWYLVVFRSVRSPEANPDALEVYDYAAHREAQDASGLLVYYRGTPNASGECLSFCVWESRQQAVHAAHLPIHQFATRIVHQMYSSFSLERFLLRKGTDKNDVRFEPMRATKDLGGS